MSVAGMSLLRTDEPWLPHEHRVSCDVGTRLTNVAAHAPYLQIVHDRCCLCNPLLHAEYATVDPQRTRISSATNKAHPLFTFISTICTW